MLCDFGAWCVIRHRVRAGKVRGQKKGGPEQPGIARPLRGFNKWKRWGDLVVAGC